MSSDESAEFHSLFADHRDRLFSFAYRLTGNAAAAEDLLQDTFLAVWRKREQYRGSGSAFAYLRKTAFRLFLNKRERMSSQAPRSPVELEELEAPAASSWDHEEDVRYLVQRVEEAVASLPSGQRQAFLLFRHKGLSCGEIANLTGAPIKTIESRVRRATHALAQRLIGLREGFTEE